MIGLWSESVEAENILFNLYKNVKARCPKLHDLSITVSESVDGKSQDLSGSVYVGSECYIFDGIKGLLYLMKERANDINK